MSLFGTASKVIPQDLEDPSLHITETSSRTVKILLSQNAKATSLLQDGFGKKTLAFITAPFVHCTRFATGTIGYYLCSHFSPIRRVNR